MRKMTVYIAGPMTGLPDLNFPAFHSEAARLRAKGYEVVNPAEINPDKDMSWRQCMRTDIAALVFCDAIQLLPGWQDAESGRRNISPAAWALFLLATGQHPGFIAAMHPDTSRRGLPTDQHLLPKS